MSPLAPVGGTGTSPLQSHAVQIATDLYFATGQLETLGEPNFFINQEGNTLFKLGQAQIAPWAFTGLPVSQASPFLINRSRVQLLLYTEPEVSAGYRRPPRTGKVLIYMPLMVVQGSVPFLSEAKLHNFMDFWKGDFITVLDAEVHFIAESQVRLPTAAPIIYLHRNFIQGYLEA